MTFSLLIGILIYAITFAPMTVLLALFLVIVTMRWCFSSRRVKQTQAQKDLVSKREQDLRTQHQLALEEDKKFQREQIELQVKEE
jgi:membrane protein implicated in regulation of membrane protease activity